MQSLPHESGKARAFISGRDPKKLFALKKVEL